MCLNLCIGLSGVVGPQTLCVNVVVDASWFVKSLGLCGHVHLLELVILLCCLSVLLVGIVTFDHFS